MRPIFPDSCLRLPQQNTGHNMVVPAVMSSSRTSTPKKTHDHYLLIDEQRYLLLNQRLEIRIGHDTTKLTKLSSKRMLQAALVSGFNPHHGTPTSQHRSITGALRTVHPEPTCVGHSPGYPLRDRLAGA